MNDVKNISFPKIQEFLKKDRKIEIIHSYYPKCFSSILSETIKVEGNKATFTSGIDRNMVRSNCLIPSCLDTVFYFEVLVENIELNGSIGIGISPKEQSLEGHLPGNNNLCLIILFYF